MTVGNAVLFIIVIVSAAGVCGLAAAAGMRLLLRHLKETAHDH